MLHSTQDMLTGQKLCRSQSHRDSVFTALNRQRKDGLFCDVTLIAGEQKFHAHRAILAACSDYFRVSVSFSETRFPRSSDFMQRVCIAACVSCS